MSKPYPQDLRDRAVRLVRETKSQYPSENQAIVSIAAKLGIATAQTLRNWVRQAEVDAGTRPGPTSQEIAEIKALGWRTPAEALNDELQSVSEADVATID
ncbi:MAG TPA: transposase [Actinocrinis sp.]|nr:transposase [Actinocrinis sp.]